MVAVKKPKPQNIKKPSTPTKTPDESKAVVSGQLKKKLAQAKPKRAHKKQSERGVILVKHLPHGFFEQQLRQYFKQFGHVTRVRLGRSQRTGGSKGFAFVEFEYPEVAKVAADTMDNYLMFQKVVKALYIPPEEQKYNYFKNTVKKVTNKAGKEIYISDQTKSTLRSVKKQNNWTESACQKRTKVGMQRIKKLQKKCKDLGIDVSEFIVKPIKKSQEQPKDVKASPTDAEKKQKGFPKELQLEQTKNVKASPADAKKKQKVSQKELKLEDLLGNTITEDSDDEEYVDESDDDSEELEMETDEDDDVDIDDDDEEEEELAPPPKKSQKKNTSAERMSELIKRKPGTGGVQKKKAVAAPSKATKNAATTKLQVAAAKQIAKPLQKKNGKKLKK